MSWIKRSNWKLESECQQYQVRKYAIGTNVLADFSGWRYQAYRADGDGIVEALGPPHRDSASAKAEAALDERRRMVHLGGERVA